MITKEMLLAGMDAGVVKLYEDPRDSDIYCKIGSHRFFFKPALNADPRRGGRSHCGAAEHFEAVRRHFCGVPLLRGSLAVGAGGKAHTADLYRYHP